MMREYPIPVKDPISHPFCFPLLPEINPPANNVTKEIPVVTTPSEDSCVEVKRKISEKMKLLTISKVKIAIIP